MKKLILCLSFIFCREAFSQTTPQALFVDVNLSQNEAHTVDRWTQKNNYNLTIVPSNARTLWDLKNKSDEFKEKMDKTSLNEHVTLYTQKIEVDREMMRNLKSGVTEVDQYLSELEKNQGNLTTLIISGHHSTDGSWYGAGITSTEGLPTNYLAQIADQHPFIHRTVKTIILAGCYSVTKLEISKIIQSFPQVVVIAGYAGTGYLDSDLSGSRYIQNVLNLSNQVQKSKLSFAQLQSELENIKVQASDKKLGIFINLNGAKYLYLGTAPEKKFVTFDDSSQSCAAFNNKDFYAWEDLLQSYLTGKRLDTTAQGHQDLLNIYTAFQNNQHCLNEKVGPILAQKLKDQAFFMRFFVSVKQNFYLTWGLEWSDLNDRYKINYRAIDDWSVADILQVIERLSKYSDDVQAVHFAKVLKSQLLGFRCTPLSWHEFKGYDGIEKPLCE